MTNPKISNATPGPWYVSEGHEKGAAEAIGILSAHRYGVEDPEVICQVGLDLMSAQDPAEREANAYLLAASREMFDLLVDIVAILPECRCGDPATCARCALLRRRRTVVQKARGEVESG